MLYLLLICSALTPCQSIQEVILHNDLRQSGSLAHPRGDDAILLNPGFEDDPDSGNPSLVQLSLWTQGHHRLPNGTSLVIVLVVAVFCFVVGGRLGHHVPKGLLSYIVCAVYVAFSVAIDLSIAIQKDHKKDTSDSHVFDFNPACSVLMTEAVKFGISGVLYSAEQWKLGAPFFPRELSFMDVRWLMVPSIVFTVNNILVFQAIGKNDMSTFGVFRDTMILWTALLWRSIFKAPLGNIRMAAIIIIFAGLVVNQVAHSTGRSSKWSWAFLWVLLMTWCNAVGSVVNEYALKLSKQLDINIQNMVLYTGCIFCTFFYILASDTPRVAGGAGVFFRGFDNRTWFTIGLQSVTGLLVSRMLKHADAVMKTVATCLRGPILVFVAPIFTRSHIGALIAISAVITASGCLTYFTQGPLKTHTEIEEELKKKSVDDP